MSSAQKQPCLCVAPLGVSKRSNCWSISHHPPPPPPGSDGGWRSLAAKDSPFRSPEGPRPGLWAQWRGTHTSVGTPCLL